MTRLLAGIDFSTTAVHAALITWDQRAEQQHAILRHARLPTFKPNTTTPQYRSVRRCEQLAGAVRTLLGEPSEQGYVCSVWIEEPFGAQGTADNVLRELYGGILATIPYDTARAPIAPSQWRHTITSRREGLGLAAPPPLVNGSRRRDWKAWATKTADAWLNAQGFIETSSEHEADALLIALAGRYLEHQGRATGGHQRPAIKGQLKLEPSTTRRTP